jgi:hypothetical protein
MRTARTFDDGQDQRGILLQRQRLPIGPVCTQGIRLRQAARGGIVTELSQRRSQISGLEFSYIP